MWTTTVDPTGSVAIAPGPNPQIWDSGQRLRGGSWSKAGNMGHQ